MTAPPGIVERLAATAVPSTSKRGTAPGKAARQRIAGPDTFFMRVDDVPVWVISSLFFRIETADKVARSRSDGRRDKVMTSNASP
jgi:hypothetical protein